MGEPTREILQGIIIGLYRAGKLEDGAVREICSAIHMEAKSEEARQFSATIREALRLDG